MVELRSDTCVWVASVAKPFNDILLPRQHVEDTALGLCQVDHDEKLSVRSLDSPAKIGPSLKVLPITAVSSRPPGRVRTAIPEINTHGTPLSHETQIFSAALEQG